MPRIVITAPIAFVITFLMFLGMRALIEGARREVDGSKRASLGDFIRLPTESVVNQKTREIPKKEPPPKTPPPPQLSMVTDSKPTTIKNTPNNFNSSSFAGASNFKPIGGLSAGSAPADSEATPVVRVQPIYPQRAAERGIEGFVVVKFKVGTAGQVVDPRIIKSDPPGVFDRAALKAVRKWKYKPKIVDGKPIEYGVTPVQLDFKL
ncbi:MAG: energy transducer TonB [Myxococcota bacterium]